jgi:hypothetical protein
MKQTRKRYTLMIAAPLAFDLFGVMSGTVSATYAAEGQPAQSEASPFWGGGWHLLQGWGHDASDRVGEASPKRTTA